MAFVLLRYSWLQHLLLSLLALPREGRLQRLPYADAISKVGLCSTLKDTERAIKHFSAAASCRRRAMFSSEPTASLACGRNVTLSNCSSAVRLPDLHAGGVVAVCYDHDTGVGAKVQVPELMTGGKRGDKQLRRTPSSPLLTREQT